MVSAQKQVQKAQAALKLIQTTTKFAKRRIIRVLKSRPARRLREATRTVRRLLVHARNVSAKIQQKPSVAAQKAKTLRILDRQIKSFERISELKDAAKLTRAARKAIENNKFEMAGALLSCQMLYLRATKKEDRQIAFDRARKIFKAKKPENFAAIHAEVQVRNRAYELRRKRGKYSLKARDAYNLSSNLYQAGYVLEGNYAATIASGYKSLASMNWRQRRKLKKLISFLDKKTNALKKCLEKKKTFAQMNGIKQAKDAARFWKKETRTYQNQVKTISFDSSISTLERHLRKRRRKSAIRIATAAREMYAAAITGITKDGKKLSKDERTHYMSSSIGIFSAMKQEALFRAEGLNANADKFRNVAIHFSRALEGTLEDKKGTAKEAEKMMRQALKSGNASLKKKRFLAAKRRAIGRLNRMEKTIKKFNKEVKSATDDRGKKIFTATAWLKEIDRQRKEIKKAENVKDLAKISIDFRAQVKTQLIQARRVLLVKRMAGKREGMRGVLRRTYLKVSKNRSLLYAQEGGIRIYRNLMNHLRNSVAQMDSIGLKSLLAKVKAGTATDAQLKRVSLQFQMASRAFEGRRKSLTLLTDAIQFSTMAYGQRASLKSADPGLASRFSKAASLYLSGARSANDSLISAEKGMILDPKAIGAKHVATQKGYKIYEVHFGRVGKKGMVQGKLYALDRRNRVFATYDFHKSAAGKYMFHLSKERGKAETAESFIKDSLIELKVHGHSYWKDGIGFMLAGFKATAKAKSGRLGDCLDTIASQRAKTWRELIRLKTSSKVPIYRVRKLQSHLDQLNRSVALMGSVTSSEGHSQKQNFYRALFRTLIRNYVEPKAILENNTKLAAMVQQMGLLKRNLERKTRPRIAKLEKLLAKYQKVYTRLMDRVTALEKAGKRRTSLYKRTYKSSLTYSDRITKLESQISALQEKTSPQIKKIESSYAALKKVQDKLVRFHGIVGEGEPLRALKNFNKAQETHTRRVNEAFKAWQNAKMLAIIAVSMIPGGQGVGLGLWGLDSTARMIRTGIVDPSELVMLGGSAATMGLSKFAKLGAAWLERATYAGKSARRIRRLKTMVAVTSELAKTTGMISGLYGAGFGVFMGAHAMGSLSKSSTPNDIFAAVMAGGMGILPVAHWVSAQARVQKAFEAKMRAEEFRPADQKRVVDSETQARTRAKVPKEELPPAYRGLIEEYRAIQRQKEFTQFEVKPAKVPETQVARNKWRKGIEKQTQDMVKSLSPEGLKHVAALRRKEAALWRKEIAQLRVEAQKYRRRMGETAAYKKMELQIKQRTQNVKLYLKTASTLLRAASAKPKAPSLKTLASEHKAFIKKHPEMAKMTLAQYQRAKEYVAQGLAKDVYSLMKTQPVAKAPPKPAIKPKLKIPPKVAKAEAAALRYLEAKDHGLIPQEVSQEHYFQSLNQAEKAVSKMDATARAEATSRYLDARGRTTNPSKAKSLAEFLVSEYYGFSNKHREFAFSDFSAYSKTMSAYKASGTKRTFTYYIQLQKAKLLSQGIVTEYKVVFPEAKLPKPKAVPVREIPTRAPKPGVVKPEARKRAEVKGEFEAKASKPEVTKPAVTEAKRLAREMGKPATTKAKLTAEEIAATAKARERIAELARKEKEIAARKPKEAEVVSLESKRAEAKAREEVAAQEVKVAVGAERETAALRARKAKPPPLPPEALKTARRIPKTEKPPPIPKTKQPSVRPEKVPSAQRRAGPREATAAAKAVKVIRPEATPEYRALPPEVAAEVKRVFREVGIPEIREYTPIAIEIAGLRKTDKRVAKVYEDTVKKYLKEVRDTGLEIGAPPFAKNIVYEAKYRARAAVYKKAGIELRPMEKYNVDDVRAKTNFPLERPVHLADLDSLFNMFVHGRLKTQAASMAGLEGPTQIVVKRMFGGTGAYRVTVVKGTQKVNVFVKETSLAPDIFAAKLFEGTGVIVPKMKEAFYTLPDGRKMEFGLMQDVSAVPGIKKAVSFRELGARDVNGNLIHKDLVEMIHQDFNGLLEKLGHAFEISRKRGLQDRHASNVWLVKKKDGTLGIAMIDLDLVASYPGAAEFMGTYAGQMGDVIQQVAFALQGNRRYASTFGAKLRDPAQTKMLTDMLAYDWKFTQYLAKELKLDPKAVNLPELVKNINLLERPVDVGGNPEVAARLRNKLAKMDLWIKLRDGDSLFKGVESAHNHDLKNRSRLHKLLDDNSGMAVGWGRSPADVQKGRRSELDGSYRTKDHINLGNQEVIPEGSHAGRFRLNSKDAKYKMDEQFGINRAAEPKKDYFGEQLGPEEILKKIYFDSWTTLKARDGSTSRVILPKDFWDFTTRIIPGTHGHNLVY